MCAIKTFCPACGQRGLPFGPLPAHIRDTALRHHYQYYGCGEMTALDTYRCPACDATDRERLYALWLDQEIDAGRIPAGSRLLHVAPERALSQKIRSSGRFVHVTADAAMGGVEHHVDLMALPFADGAFDLFICSHVLEHVASDRLAVAELFRVLAPAGRGILMAPVVVGLAHTLEDPGVTTDEERWRRYGQNDHVRLYAHDDYVGLMTRAGFRVDQLGVEYFGRTAFEVLGLKESSILYIVTKPSQPGAARTRLVGPVMGAELT